MANANMTRKWEMPWLLRNHLLSQPFKGSTIRTPSICDWFLGFAGASNQLDSQKQDSTRKELQGMFTLLEFLFMSNASNLKWGKRTSFRNHVRGGSPSGGWMLALSTITLCFDRVPFYAMRNSVPLAFAKSCVSSGPLGGTGFWKLNLLIFARADVRLKWDR